MITSNNKGAARALDESIPEGQVNKQLQKNKKQAEQTISSDTGAAEVARDALMQEAQTEEESAATATLDGTCILPFAAAEGEYYFEPVGELKLKPVFATVKRLFDFFVSFIMLAVLALPMIIIAIIIKIDSRGPVLYKQQRLGKKGKPFKIYKFRSMRIDSEASGAQWAQEDDPRCTKFGKFMRKVRLDELPQLINILFSQMSFVGPRPEREIFYDKFETYVHGFHERLKVKPGLTGLAQVNGGYDLKPEEKLAFDLEYIKKRSLWLDLKVLFKTVGVVLGRKGAK